MSKIYGLEADIKLSKSSLSADVIAFEALRRVHEILILDEDNVELYDLDEQHCLLKVAFYIDDRPNASAGEISGFIDLMAPHAVEAFRVSGENEDCGQFDDVLGPVSGVVDMALEVGREHAKEALQTHELEAHLDAAMRYCGESKSQAVSQLVQLLRTNEDLLPEGIAQLIEPTLSQLEKTGEQAA